jgi:pimeloyl-ACP methyl ester carboxylesterase
VLAARQLDDVELADETVVWGHSQGGGAALWTGGLATDYAPDVGVIGVAALAPASDLVGLMDNLPNVTGGSIFATYALDAYASVYDDVDLDSYVRPAARPAFDAAADRCLAEPAALLSVAGSLAFGTSGFRGDLTEGPLRARLEQNIPVAPIDAPLLIAQGEADSLVLPSVQDQYVADRCAAGQPIDYRTYPGRDHVPLVEPDSPLLPELFAWTEARLDGASPTPNCPER